jgi:histone-lysine N-methyltransferase SETMAR
MDPHLLNPEQKRIRVNMAGELLRVLWVQDTRQWHDLVMLDESWFDLRSEHDLMWTAPREIVLDREGYAFQWPKFMVTIVWNPSGFHVVTLLPRWSKFNAQYYTNNILGAISDWRRLSGRTQQGKLWLHADNARPHTAMVSTDYVTCNGMKRAPHPPYSPDLAPSSFFLFGYVKKKLMGYQPESESELRVRIRVILAEIPRDVLNAVFLEWIDRLQKCVHINGDSVE